MSFQLSLGSLSLCACVHARCFFVFCVGDCLCFVYVGRDFWTGSECVGREKEEVEGTGESGFCEVSGCDVTTAPNRFLRLVFGCE